MSMIDSPKCPLNGYDKVTLLEKAKHGDQFNSNFEPMGTGLHANKIKEIAMQHLTWLVRSFLKSSNNDHLSIQFSCQLLILTAKLGSVVGIHCKERHLDENIVFKFCLKRVSIKNISRLRED